MWPHSLVREITQNSVHKLLSILLVFSLLSACKSEKSAKLHIHGNASIALIGGNLGSRMMHYGYFETELQIRYADSLLIIRNMCDGGDTPGFRPHSGRNHPWAFPGADQYQTEFARNSGSEGHFETPDQWLERLGSDIIISFFGYSESFQGSAGLENFKSDLEAFILHTVTQKYNGTSAPQLAIVSPIAFEDLSDHFDLPTILL